MNSPTFRIFCWAFGLFGFLHLLVYAFQFGAVIYVTTSVIAGLGLALFLYPESRGLFALLIGVMVTDGWLQMPTYSNHTILKNFFLLAVLVSAAWQLLRRGTWDGFVQDFAPAGRALLATMYVFGVFHKINTDFLNPDVSCAVSLWQQMPLGLAALDHPWMLQLTIWGTLVIESLILLCLLVRPWRNIGILVGIAFHSLLALSGYALYVPFSMLTVCLHLLYLEPASAQAIVNSAAWTRTRQVLASWRGRAALALWLGLLALLSWAGSFSQVGLLWLPAIGVLLWLLMQAPVQQRHAQLGAGLFWSRNWAVTAVGVLFFFNCITPYLGLKTSQSLNMFANLRLEGGVSNHLLLAHAPAPFNYLEDLVTVVEAHGSPTLRRASADDLRLVYYDFLDHVDRERGVVASFVRNGVMYENQTAQTLASEIDQHLHPRWFRKWFHFNPVDLRSPKPCALDR